MDNSSAPPGGEEAAQRAWDSLVKPHPWGGYTVAVPVNRGTARVYVGRWETRGAALWFKVNTPRKELRRLAGLMMRRDHV